VRGAERPYQYLLYYSILRKQNSKMRYEKFLLKVAKQWAVHEPPAALTTDADKNNNTQGSQAGPAQPIT
jgi:hypothetical protein